MHVLMLHTHISNTLDRHYNNTTMQNNPNLHLKVNGPILNNMYTSQLASIHTNQLCIHPQRLANKESRGELQQPKKIISYLQ